jgi:hypothetical protein
VTSRRPDDHDVGVRRELALVTTRLHRLERLYVSALCVLVVGLLVAGTLLPLFTLTTSSRTPVVSLLTALGRLLEHRYSPSSEDGAPAVGVLLALVLLAVLLIPVVRAALGRSSTSLDVWNLRVLVPTALVSFTVLTLTARATARDLDPDAVHGPGGILLVAGSAAAGLLLTPRVQAIMSPSPAAASGSDGQGDAVTDGA